MPKKKKVQSPELGVKVPKRVKHALAPYNDTYIEQGSGVARNHCAIAEPLDELATGLSLVPTMKKINALKKDFSAVSFFAGCGGASTGLKMSGFNVLFSNEFIPAAADTYRLNHPQTIVDTSDIRELTAKQVLKKIGLERGELDLFDFSPPCKAFSSAGVQEEGWNKEVMYSDGVKQRVDDLFDHGVRILKGLKPKTFIAENVAGLVKGVSRGFFTEILADLTAAGYRVKAYRIDPVLLGIPQTRERLIYVGVRNDLKMDPVPPQIVPHNKRKTVRDVLPHVKKIKSKRGKLLAYVTSNVPSPTIVASDYDTSETARFSCGGWCEDNKGRRRKYTLLELRRLMCFPDDFKLTGNPRQQWERLGRSHVPLQVHHLSKALRKQILEPYYDSKGSKYSSNIR